MSARPRSHRSAHRWFSLSASINSTVTPIWLPDLRFEHIAYAKVAAELPHIDREALVAERRIAGDYEQRRAARQRRDDVLRYSIREEFLQRVVANVGERQHRERRLRSQFVIGIIRRQTLAPFEHCEYLLSPTMAVLPHVAELPWPPSGTAHTPFYFPFSLSEQPAASINGGFSRDGLPIGLQIVGRCFSDYGVLRAALAFERATLYCRRHPAL
jgi:Asp-tRNA(Asn)/Glu-tRNA(Gln) amidotransferase A subunit family amidase